MEMWLPGFKFLFSCFYDHKSNIFLKHINAEKDGSTIWTPQFQKNNGLERKMKNWSQRWKNMARNGLKLQVFLTEKEIIIWLKTDIIHFWKNMGWKYSKKRLRKWHRLKIPKWSNRKSRNQGNRFFTLW